MKPTSAWQPTAAHTRAVVAGMVMCALAVGFRRPALLVLAAPLVVAAVAGTATRPRSTPTVRHRLAHGTLGEGQATTYRVDVDDQSEDVETVSMVVRPQHRLQLRPALGQATTSHRAALGRHRLDVVIRFTRWGMYSIPRALVVATSAWGAHRWIAPQDGPALRVAVVPGSGQDRSTGEEPVAVPGLVGSHRSPRYGAGSEFATIRPFAPGDRLTRIRWPRSLRSGTLHVASTWADQDRHVVLVVDALFDVGVSGGIDGDASSLDLTVRTAADLAADHLGRGDRVSLVTVGAQRFDALPAATGSSHLQRILVTLASLAPAGVRLGPDRIPKQLGRGSLVLVLSSLRDPWMLSRVVAMTSQGLTVIVVDCLPADLETRHAESADHAAAWRIDRLRRQYQFQRAAAMGIAIVPAGGIDLDTVVRRVLQRRVIRSGFSP